MFNNVNRFVVVSVVALCLSVTFGEECTYAGEFCPSACYGNP